MPSAQQLRQDSAVSRATARRPLWDPNGLATIESTIDVTPGTKVVFSYSEGARSVTDWLSHHADDPDAPSPDDLSFVVIGNPTRTYGGSDNAVLPQTQYQVIDVSRQYDIASDFPDNPFNLLALLNSLAAFTVIHTDYENVDMYDPANIVWKEGNTTYVFVPTENLPLLEPLRNLGLKGLADALNGPLKDIVERGYDRSYLPDAEGAPSDTAALSAPLSNDTAAQAVQRKAVSRDVNDMGAVETHVGAPASEVDGDANAEAPRTSGAREADADGTDADEAAATTDVPKHLKSRRTAKAGTESAASDQTTARAGAEPDATDSAGAEGAGPDGPASSDDSADTSGDSDT